jgi:hypothetical protein
MPHPSRCGVTGVDIYELTDEQVDAAVAARRANPEPPRHDDAYWLTVLAQQAEEEAE